MRGFVCIEEFRLRDATDLDCIRPLWTVGDFKCDAVAFAKLVKPHAIQIVGMEKEVFVASFAFDEPEPSISEAGDCSFLHEIEKKLIILRLLMIARPCSQVNKIKKPLMS